MNSMQMMKRVCLSLLVLLAIIRTASAASAKWSPVPQPGLAAALDGAPELTFEEFAEGPSVCVQGPIWWVPNPGGKTWDMVMIYSRSYPGPHEAFIYDPAANELKFGGYPLGENVVSAVRMAPNDDATLFGGFGPLAKDQTKVGFYTIDPVTLKGEFLGEVGPESKSRAWEYGGVVMDGDWIYARYGASPWRLYGMNVKTRQGKVIDVLSRTARNRQVSSKTSL
jgi:hypothetical protein